MTYQEAYAKALKLLNIRFLSEGELRKKLARYEVSPVVMAQVIDKLKEENFLNDERLAQAVYRYYVQKKKYGHAYIANRLRLRQLPVPEDVERPDEYALAEKLVQHKFPHGWEDARKVARYLQNRGIATSVISEILWS